MKNLQIIMIIDKVGKKVLFSQNIFKSSTLKYLFSYFEV